VTLQCE